MLILPPSGSYPADEELSDMEKEIKLKLGETPDGGELFGTIVMDDSTWSIEKGGLEGNSTLIVTLTKSSVSNWTSLLKSN